MSYVTQTLRKSCRVAGFTLLEMMLVVGLIALTATYISINIGQSDAKLAKLEAKRFVAMMNLAQDESIMTGQPIKLIVDVGQKQYRFEPLAQAGIASQITGEASSEGDLNIDENASKQAGDLLTQPRTLPNAVQMSFEIQPVELKKNKGGKFVPKRVHEILNTSLFDGDDELGSDDFDDDNVLIEPNGIISPFTLTLSVAQNFTTVELDRFGKARIVNINK